MRVAPAVSRRKFERELDVVKAHAGGLLRERGCLLLDAEFPDLRFVFVPRNPVVFTFPVLVPGPVATIREENTLIPLLSDRAFGVRIALDDYDQRAPSVLLCDPWTWDALPHYSDARAMLEDSSGNCTNVYIKEHPDTHKPFLCMRGIREYHEHPQHSGDDWMLYRGSIGVLDILQRVWLACVRTPHANLIWNPPNALLRWVWRQNNGNR